MIKIHEKKSVKNVGTTSLFVSFDYNPEIVNVIKGAENAIYDKTNKTWELPLNKLSYLIDNLTLIDDISLEFIRDTEKKEKLSISIDYKTKPFDHQNEAIEWLINNQNGLLLDVPGLGKTLDIIYAAEELKKQKGIEHCLIICGINTLKNNWKKEIQTHSNLDCVIIGEKINSKGKISYSSIKERAEQLYQPIDEFFIILNVESIRDNTVIDAIRSSKNKFDMICIDEVHRCKSPTSDQGKNLLKLAKIGTYHYGLTGTILVNNPLDAYMPLKFIGKERANFTNFKNFYCNIDWVFGHQQISGYKNIDILKEEIAECSLRRNKDLLNLPPKIIVPEYLDLTESQLKFYDNLQKGIVEEADRVNIKTTSLLGMIVRLRQATSCPSVLSTHDISNVKIERALDLIEEITSNNEKVIVFSSFKEPLYVLQEKLGNQSLLCTGDQSDEEISKNIETFQEDDEHKVILCTSSKMGTGITLTRASYEIFIDSSWTAALEEQCEDRAHRIGTEKSVIVYKLICNHTIDERVWKLLNQKKEISDYIIDDKSSETEDLKFLLGLN